GPYLSERAWGTVREDYSAHGGAWEHLPHEHAHAKAYRWNEDGLAGLSDRHQIMCFSVALWNGKDPILKERIFGLTGNQGNQGRRRGSLAPRRGRQSRARDRRGRGPPAGLVPQYVELRRQEPKAQPRARARAGRRARRLRPSRDRGTKLVRVRRRARGGFHGE